MDKTPIYASFEFGRVVVHTEITNIYDTEMDI